MLEWLKQKSIDFPRGAKFNLNAHVIRDLEIARIAFAVTIIKCEHSALYRIK